MDLESNTTAAVSITGLHNEFYGMTCRGLVSFAAGAVDNKFFGGSVDSITFNMASSFNELIGVGYNITGSGTFTDNNPGQNSYRRLYNLNTGGLWDGISTETSPRVGASPFVYTNATMENQFVGVSGGTVSAISIKRGSNPQVSTGLTSGQFVLGPGDLLIVSFSSVPTTFAVFNF